MTRKSHTINLIPQETLDLLHDAKDREAKRSGYGITFQAYLRKILQDAAENERTKQSVAKKLQEKAAAEYAKQASEDVGE